MDWNQLQQAVVAKPPPGTNAHKLSWAQVNEIREIYGEGRMSMQQLASKFGVHKGTIHRIVRYVYW